MLTEWLTLPGAVDQISAWSQIIGIDLVHLGTTATADQITDTAVTQPLVVAATLLAHCALTQRGYITDQPTVVAGHSVGEIAAYAIAGVISADDAVRLAAVRGAEMATACAAEPTGMAAVLGGDEADVLTRLEALDLIPANRNATGQIVAAGAIAALEKLAEDPPAKARVRRLATAGAFHTHYMASAQAGYDKALKNITISEPTTTVLSNADGQPVVNAADAMDKLAAQLTRPVRWDLCCATLRQLNTTTIVEFPPAGALVGIAKRELRGVATQPVTTPADLDGLAEL